MWDQGVAFLFYLANQAANFMLVQQQLFGASGIGIHMGGGGF